MLAALKAGLLGSLVVLLAQQLESLSVKQLELRLESQLDLLAQQ